MNIYDELNTIYHKGISCDLYTHLLLCDRLDRHWSSKAIIVDHNRSIDIGRPAKIASTTVDQSRQPCLIRLRVLATRNTSVDTHADSIPLTPRGTTKRTSPYPSVSTVTSTCRAWEGTASLPQRWRTWELRMIQNWWKRPRNLRNQKLWPRRRKKRGRPKPCRRVGSVPKRRMWII